MFTFEENRRSFCGRIHIYAVQIDDDLYVLHAFQKKAKRGIATPKKEIDLIKQRLKMAKAISKKIDSKMLFN